MRKELQEIEIIENYLMDKMNASEKGEFENQLKSDSALARNVELQKGLVAGLERIGLKDDFVKAKRSLFMRKLGIWFGVLLIGLAGLGAVYVVNTDAPAVIKITQSAKDERLKIKEDRTPVESSNYKDENKLVESLKDTVKSGFSAPLEDLTKRSKTGDKSSESDIVSAQDSSINFAQIPTKQFQTFKIDPARENTITGEEGTIITIPKHAFDTESDKIVTVKLKEFYKLSDIAFANLTTQTKDGELIETGGMVNIEAFDYANNKLKLKSDQSIKLEFPFEKKKEGMLTFLGEKDEFGNIVWEEESQELNIVDIQESKSRTLVFPKLDFESAQIFMIVEDMPVFKGCESLNSKSLKEECTNEKMIEFLNKNAKHPKYNSKISGKNKVYVRFMINEMGMTNNVNVLRSTAPELNKYAIAAVKSLPRFKPGKQRGIPVRVQYTIPINYNVAEGSPNGLNEKELERYLSEIDKKSKEEIEKSIEGVFEDTTISERDQLSLAQGYVLSSAYLGYINCDRYPLATKGKASFNIFENDETINCSLILHSVRGIVKPRYIKQGKYVFPQLPIQEKLSILAFKNVNGNNYVSFEKTVHDQSNHTFKFEPLTKEKLQLITKSLNDIKN